MKNLNKDFVRKRITALRLIKGVSENKMSLALGHGRNYIHNIATGKYLPTMASLMQICEYFEITPSDFFDEKVSNPILVRKLLNSAKEMSDEDIIWLNKVIDRLNEHRE